MAGAQGREKGRRKWGGWREFSNTNWVRHGSKHFTYMNSFHPQTTQGGYNYLSSFSVFMNQ